jgi:HK97 family phage prohead protease
MAIKSIAADGSFEGALAVYGNEDLGGDVLEFGSCTKTLEEHGNEVPLLWQHKTDTPIGKLTLTDTPKALLAKGQLLMDLPVAKNAYLLIKNRIVKGMSIGFDSMKETVIDNVRHLKEIRLWEGSIVTFPMNEMALITSVKSWRERQVQRKQARLEGKGDFTSELADIRLQDAMYQMYQAVRYSLMSIPWTDMTPEEKIAASETCLDQFKTEYMEFLPAFLDMLDREMGSDYYTYGHEPGETKSGKKLSAATKQTIATAAAHSKSASDILTALCAEDEAATEEEAPIGTSSDKAADGTREPEPAIPIDHSASITLIGEIKALIPAA